LINRENWKLYKQYLSYRHEVEQVSLKTIANEETWLRHFVEWADNTSFQKVQKIRPTFPNYLLKVHSDRKRKPLSSSYVKKVIRAAYRFFSWLATHKRGFKQIGFEFLDTLRTPKQKTKPKVREHVSIEEIRNIAQTPVRSTKEKRIRAAAVFLWLSGMRVSAFASLPLEAVDLDKLEIKQYPSLGMRTKNNKYGDTTLLKIPDLLNVVRAWDKEIRSVLPPNGLWFAPLLPSNGEIDLHATVETIGENRGRAVTRNLRAWLNENNLPYHSPHKFRHGHAIYVKKHAKSFADLEALKENLMHESIQTTDQTYGLFDKNDMKERLHNLSNLEEINLLEEIPPEDRDFVLEIYRLYKQKHNN
jgi:site-specific recombinase XerC